MESRIYREAEQQVKTCHGFCSLRRRGNGQTLLPPDPTACNVQPQTRRAWIVHHFPAERRVSPVALLSENLSAVLGNSWWSIVSLAQ